tara:strand:- start:6502 stop:6798 length:297 start_codon:yes stop_codon:yes gene_type:complete
MKVIIAGGHRGDIIHSRREINRLRKELRRPKLIIGEDINTGEPVVMFARGRIAEESSKSMHVGGKYKVRGKKSKHSGKVSLEVAIPIEKKNSTNNRIY